MRGWKAFAKTDDDQLLMIVFLTVDDQVSFKKNGKPLEDNK